MSSSLRGFSFNYVVTEDDTDNYVVTEDDTDK